MKKIIVIGSSNVDMVVRTSHLPAPGETILGGEFFMNQGGKGANQAVAIKRLGGNLIFMAKLRNDVLGRQSVGNFAVPALGFVITGAPGGEVSLS